MKILLITTVGFTAMLAPLARQPQLPPTTGSDLPAISQAAEDNADAASGEPCGGQEAAEAASVRAEQRRAAEELARAAAEQDRALAEQKRSLAEQQHALAEQAKSREQEARQIAESVRAQAEQIARVAKEEAARMALDKGRLSEEIQSQVEAALAQTGQALRQLHLAQAAVPAPPAAAAPANPGVPAAPPTPAKASTSRSASASASRNAYSSDSSRRPARALVISPQQSDPKFVAEVEEDFAIMSRILEKEVGRDLGRDGPKEAMGIWISSSDSRSPQAIFLDGYGALFLLQVNFPLVAPAEKKAESKPEPPDTPWERTRKEVFGQAEHDALVKQFSVYSKFDLHRSEPEYDAAKVDKLRESLLDALKNAANIRHLRADDAVVLAVSSGGGSSHSSSFTLLAPGNNSLSTVTETVTAVDKLKRVGDGGGGRSSTMTIRAKKSDADAFASGKLSADEFRKKASVNVY
jgi:hypothetical protein